MTISTIVLTIAVVFRGGEDPDASAPSSPKDEGTLKMWLNRLEDALKRLAEKAIEALPAIVGSVVGAILSCLGKGVRFAAEHIWALIVYDDDFIGICLMQKVKK